MVKFGKIREFVHFTSRKLLLNHMVVEKWFVKKKADRRLFSKIQIQGITCLHNLNINKIQCAQHWVQSLIMIWILNMVKFGKIREFVHFTSRKLLLNHMVVEKWFVKKKADRRLFSKIQIQGITCLHNLNINKIQCAQHWVQSLIMIWILNMNMFVHAY